MAITDRELWLSQQQALTTGTQYSNAYDLGLARDMGIGTSVRAVVNVSTTFAGGTNETINLVQSANTDLSSPDILVSSGALLEAAMTAGTRLLNVVVPKTTKRYVGFQYIASGTHTGGAVDGLLMLDNTSGDSFPVETGR